MKKTLNISRKIKYYRIRLALTQEEFAKKLGVSTDYVVGWESGEIYPEVDHMITLETFFSLSKGTLFEMDRENIENDLKMVMLKWDIVFALFLFFISKFTVFILLNMMGIKGIFFPLFIWFAASIIFIKGTYIPVDKNLETQKVAFLFFSNALQKRDFNSKILLKKGGLFVLFFFVELIGLLASAVFFKAK